MTNDTTDIQEVIKRSEAGAWGRRTKKKRVSPRARLPETPTVQPRPVPSLEFPSVLAQPEPITTEFRDPIEPPGLTATEYTGQMLRHKAMMEEQGQLRLLEEESPEDRWIREYEEELAALPPTRDPVDIREPGRTVLQRDPLVISQEEFEFIPRHELTSQVIGTEDDPILVDIHGRPIPIPGPTPAEYLAGSYGFEMPEFPDDLKRQIDRYQASIPQFVDVLEYPPGLFEQLRESASALVTTMVVELATPGIGTDFERRRDALRDEGAGFFESVFESYQQADIPPWLRFAIEMIFDPLILAPGIGIGGTLMRLGMKAPNALRVASLIGKEVSIDVGRGVSRGVSRTVSRVIPEGVPAKAVIDATGTAIPPVDTALARAQQAARLADAEAMARGPRAKVAILEERLRVAQEDIKNIERLIPEARKRLEMAPAGTPQDEVIRNEIEWFLETVDEQLAAARLREKTIRRSLLDAETRLTRGRETKKALVERDLETGRGPAPTGLARELFEEAPTTAPTTAEPPTGFWHSIVPAVIANERRAVQGIRAKYQSRVEAAFEAGNDDVYKALVAARDAEEAAVSPAMARSQVLFKERNEILDGGKLFHPTEGKFWERRINSIDDEMEELSPQVDYITGITDTLPTPAAPTPAAQADAARVAEGVDIKLAQTGQPFRGSLFRGSGRATIEDVYDPHFFQGPIFGEATYTSPSREFAKNFGPQVDELEVSLRNPLVISSDTEWRALTEEAGLFSNVPASAEEATRLRQVIQAKGHDGVIIRVPESEMVGKRLQQAFTEDTVASFDPPTIPSTPTAATRPANLTPSFGRELGRGVYFSTDRQIAQGFAEGRAPFLVGTARTRKGTEVVSRFVIPKDTKIFTRDKVLDIDLLEQLQQRPTFARHWADEWSLQPASRDNIWAAAEETRMLPELQSLLESQGFKGARHTQGPGQFDYAIWDSSIIKKEGTGLQLFRGATPAAAQAPTSRGPVIEWAAAPETVRPDLPRTMSSMVREARVREARGLRAETPEQRAAIMDMAYPIDEGDLIFKVDSFSAPAERALGSDTPISRWVRSIPGLKESYGVWTPAQMERLNPVAMIGIRKAIFESIETGRARFAALMWQNEAAQALGFIYKRDAWRAKKVKPSAIGNRAHRDFGTIDDILEHPENYVLTSQQQRVIKRGQDMTTQLLRDAQRAGVDVVELGEAYWHRIIIKGPKEKDSGSFIRNRLSGRKGYTLKRAFDKVDLGTELGYKYETHPLRRLIARMEAGIHTISNAEARRQINRLPGVSKPLERLQAQFPDTVAGVKAARAARNEAKAAYLRNENPETLMALRQAEAEFVTAQGEFFKKNLDAATPGYYEKSLLSGRVVPKELYDEIERYIVLPEYGNGSAVMGHIRAGAQMSRTMLTTLDLAAGFIQGQTLFYSNNAAWWKAQAHAIVSLIDDPTAYVAKNFDIIDEGVRMTAISEPTEFLFARHGLGSIPTRIPIIGPGLRAFNRAFEWFILVGQTELYKAARGGVVARSGKRALRGGVPVEEQLTQDLVSLGSAIRKSVGTESYAILGVRPTQQTIEAIAFFAGRFFRANIGILVQSLTAGEGGRFARRQVGALIAGGTSITIGAHWAITGKPPNLTNPFEPNWLQVPLGNTYFNAFGPFYPYLRTVARMSHHMVNGKPLQAEKEWRRFVISKAGIPWRAVDMIAQFWQNGTYITFEGDELGMNPLDILRAITGEFFTPISAADIYQGIREGRHEEVLSLAGITGRGNADAQMDIMFRRMEDINPEGVGWGEADPKQRDEMKKLFPKIWARMLKAGRGKYGEAQRKWAEVNADRYYAEEELIDRLTEPEVVWDPSKFRSDYDSLQEAAANWKRGINSALDLFQEERELPDDPKDRALAQYYQAFELARMGPKLNSELDHDKLNELMDELDDEWTPSQKAYVDENTGRTDHPPFAQAMGDARKYLRPIFDIYDEMLVDPSLTEEGREVWSEYLQQGEAGKEAMRIGEHEDLLDSLFEFLADRQNDLRIKDERLSILLFMWYGPRYDKLDGQHDANRLYDALYPVGQSRNVDIRSLQETIGVAQ